MNVLAETGTQDRSIFMKLKDFLRLGLETGNKVKVSLRTADPVEAVFGGFRTYGTVLRPEMAHLQLFPIFHAIGRDGKRSDRSPWDGTSPDVGLYDISSCEKID